MKNKTYFASCLCKGVSLSIKGELRSVINCHCISCLKTHGNYAAYTATNEKNIHYISKKTLKWYNSSTFAKRGFCFKCGSSIFFKRKKSDHVSISAGLFKKPTNLSTSANIYVENKRDYYEIKDKYPKYKRYFK